MLPRLATFWSRITSIAVTLVLIGVRQQGQEASALDRDRQLTLIERLRTRDATRNDLARLGDVALQRGQILIVNVLHALGGEATKLLTAGEKDARAPSTPPAAPATVIAAAGATAATTTITATTAATAAIFIKSHCSLPRALRRLLRPGRPRHPRQQSHLHAGGAAAARRRRRDRH